MEYSTTKIKYVNLEDGRTVLDLHDSNQKTDLFSYIMENPNHRRTFEALIDSRDTPGLYQWLESLDKSVLSSGSQKSYVSHVFRDCVFQKFPQEKEAYEKLKGDLNGKEDNETRSLKGIEQGAELSL
jgi:GrpB-like predicted nucleotidyltransferase (UPF0157 family)